MNDYLITFEQHKDIKEIDDLIDEIRKLRYHYNTQQYDAMYQHIHFLMAKYYIETAAWNLTNQIAPRTAQEAYINAEAFLRVKGFSLLLQKGIQIQDQLSAEEMKALNSIVKQRN